MLRKDKLIQRCEKTLEKYNRWEGIWLQRKVTENEEYFTMVQYDNEKGRKTQNLGKPNETVMEISGYRYLKKALHWLEHNDDVRAVDPNFSKLNISKTYHNLPRFVYDTIGVPSVEDWLAKYPTDPNYKPEGRHLQTKAGHLVRSKSEVFIADALTDFGIPYAYEPALYINGITIHPDFLILIPHAYKVFIWEHFGKMDDLDYLKHVPGRIDLLDDLGYHPHRNLIITMETAKHPLSAGDARSLIKESLLPLELVT